MENSEFTTRFSVEFVLPNNLVIEGELRSIFSPRVIERLLSKLPIQSRIHLWQREFYFEVGIRMGLEKAVSSCNGGDIAYWPQGDAVCLFFEKMTPYSKVSPIGQFTLEEYNESFSDIRSGMLITMRLKP